MNSQGNSLDTALKTCCDRIVVLAYDKRLDEGTVTITDELRQRWCEPELFLAGDGELFPRQDYAHIDEDAQPRRQAYNYAVCLHKILRRAMEDGVRRLLFLEDDATFCQGFEGVFSSAWAGVQRLQQWDLFRLGGNHVNGIAQLVAPHLLWSNYSLDLHACVFNHTAFPKILKEKPSSHCTIDGTIGEMQRRGELLCFACHPTVVTQRDGWSFNEQREVSRRSQYWEQT